MYSLYLVLVLAVAAFARPNIDISEDRLDLPEERGDLFEGDMLDDPDKRNAIYNRLWPNGRIPYTFDPQYESQFTATDKARIQEAFSDYAKYTCLRIVPKTASDTAYINIIRGGGCYSNVGRIGRKQTLSLGRGCTGKGTIIHEFMHASGFHHEQGRTDRDSYITIKYENISPGMESQFTKYTKQQVQDLGAPYDYGSVMHYSAYAFSKNRQATIVPKQAGAKIGNRKGFSQYDIYKLNKLYKCPNQPTLGPYSTLKPGASTKPVVTVKPTSPPPKVFRESFACDFESGTCGFTGSASDNFDWTRYRGNTPSGNTGPRGDHTRNGAGYYMYTEASNPRKAGEKAHLMSPEFRGTVGRVYCLDFWYSMNGTGMGRLNVFNKPVGTTSAKGIFSKIGNQGNRWINAKVAITYQNAFHFIFEGIVGSSFLSDIAVDDVRISAGNCGAVVTNQPTTTKRTQPPTTKAPVTTPKPTLLKGGFVCTFNQNSCGFTQASNDKFDWTRLAGSTSSGSTGPTTGNGGAGSYYYIEASSPRVDGDRARLVSPVMETTGTYCLEFFYHMYGADMGQFKVYTVKNGAQTLVFQKAGDQGDKWMKQTVQLNLSGKTQIAFDGIRGKSYRSDLAIDDVSVKTGQCPKVVVTTSKPVTFMTQPPTAAVAELKCNFDRNMCNFVQSPSDKFDWTHQIGTTSSGNTGPTADHTSGSGKYIYIEASSPRVTGDNAVIATPTISTGVKCVSFWLHMWGSSMGELKVFRQYGGVRRQIVSKKGDQGNKWSYVQVTESFSANSQVVFEAIRGTNFASDIAIDDVVITSGACGAVTQPPVVRTAKPTSTVPTTKTPWQCHFESGQCGMTLSAPSGSGYKWLRRAGQTSSSATGPITGDHTKKDGTGFYVHAEASSPAKQGDKAWIDTPLFAPANDCLKFYYNMNGADIEQLNVYLGSAMGFVSSTPMFTTKGDQGDTWKEARVTIRSGSPFKVRFEAIRGANFRGDIAIDDISLSSGCSAVITAPVGK